jgi:mono/diheme cytochrome c family protein
MLLSGQLFAQSCLSCHGIRDVSEVSVLVGQMLRNSWVSRRPEALLRGALGRYVARGVANGVA